MILLPLKSAEINFKNNIFLIHGDLDFSNINMLYKKSLPYLPSVGRLIFDFSQVKSSNSAGLALMIEWQKYALAHHQKLEFQHLPANLLVIAQAANLLSLLKI